MLTSRFTPVWVPKVLRLPQAGSLSFDFASSLFRLGHRCRSPEMSLVVPRGSGAVMDSRPHVSQGKADRDNTSWRCNRIIQLDLSCFTLGFMHPKATF